MTPELLHLEYLQEHPDGYRYTRFGDLYREWLGRRGLTMRQVHIAGEHTFVDYSGKKPCIVNRQTGEVIEVELFVAVLGASNYTYAEATRTQQSPERIRSHINAVEYFGGDESIHDERLGLLVDAEWSARHNKRLSRNLREATLKFPTRASRTSASHHAGSSTRRWSVSSRRAS